MRTADVDQSAAVWSAHYSRLAAPSMATFVLLMLPGAALLVLAAHLRGRSYGGWPF
jgi:hypothetical protein